MELRRVKETDDFAQIAGIYVRSWQAAYEGIVPQGYLDALDPGPWSALLSGDALTSYVLLDGGRYIGTASICPARDEAKKGWGELVSLYLLPEQVGKGLGALILKSVLVELRIQGYRDVYLWVLEENRRAKSFYEAHGFTATEDIITLTIGEKELREVRYVCHCFKA